MNLQETFNKRDKKLNDMANKGYISRNDEERMREWITQDRITTIGVIEEMVRGYLIPENAIRDLDNKKNQHHMQREMIVSNNTLNTLLTSLKESEDTFLT